MLVPRTECRSLSSSVVPAAATVVLCTEEALPGMSPPLGMSRDDPEALRGGSSAAPVVGGRVRLVKGGAFLLIGAKPNLDTFYEDNYAHTGKY